MRSRDACSVGRSARSLALSISRRPRSRTPARTRSNDPRACTPAVHGTFATLQPVHRAQRCCQITRISRHSHRSRSAAPTLGLRTSRAHECHAEPRAEFSSLLNRRLLFTSRRLELIRFQWIRFEWIFGSSLPREIASRLIGVDRARCNGDVHASSPGMYVQCLATRVSFKYAQK